MEKQPGFDVEGRGLRADLAAFLGPQFPALAGLEDLRIFNRYTVEAADGTAPLSGEEFQRAVKLVFSEPQCDRVFGELPLSGGARCFGVEYLPGQYDQRADSARQCLELVLGKKCRVRCAKFYVLLPGPSAHGKDGEGDENRGLGEGEIGAVKNYLINPVDSREVPEGETPADDAEGPEDRFSGNGRPGPVPVLEGFTGMDGGALASLASKYGLAMSLPDLSFCRDYFISEGRDPTLTEIRVLDTYWSDHCRHTTFNTVLKSIDIEDGPGAQALRGALDLYLQTRKEVYGNDEAPPRTLMDMAVIGAAALKKRGLLPDLDESKEINACTLKVKARFAGREEPWLLLFKNETHNHPTEIEPFGGAATCLGGAIRDPLAGRAYVFKAMRIS
ncbi:MAG: phosphoribosylformylglycinamidine synthase, partial [Treponema sp.]|nr:phosphoribosylformylglycinamidine synthase [Treponema sp.]